jgi:hypothetical protein
MSISVRNSAGHGGQAAYIRSARKPKGSRKFTRLHTEGLKRKDVTATPERLFGRKTISGKSAAVAAEQQPSHYPLPPGKSSKNTSGQVTIAPD